MTARSLTAVLPAGVAANIVSAGLLVVATIGAAGEQEVAAQLGWLTAGVAGLVLALLADAAVLLAGRRRLARAARRLTTGQQPARGASVSIDARAGSQVVVVPSAIRYHRSDCALAVGKPMNAAARELHELSGYRPCGVCRP